MIRIERKDSEVSPHTVTKPAPSNARGDIAPWEQPDAPSPATQLNNYRSELSAMQGGSIPTITQQPPSAISPWSGTNEKMPPMPTSIFAGSFYNDSSENLGQISPGFSPPDGMRFPTDGSDDRRPSVATVSSTGSKSSISGVSSRYKKKLQGFFGEEYPGAGDGAGSRQGSETSSMQGGALPAFAPGGGGSRNRNNSMNDAMLRSGPPSPTSSRPRTPGGPGSQGASSEVTPWVFQDQQVGHWVAPASCCGAQLTLCTGSDRFFLS